MRPVLIKISLLTFGVFVGVALLELFLRIWPYEGHRERDKLSSRFHPYYSSPEPALQSYPNQPPLRDDASSVVVNGRTFAVTKDSKEKRILFVGDSGTLGSGVSLQESFPLQFEQLVNDSLRHGSVSVINAGRKGLSTVGELKLFEDDLLKLNPDVVILGLFMANDLNFNLAHASVEKISGVNTFFLKSFYFFRRYSALVHLLYLRLLALNSTHRFTSRLGLQDCTWIPVEYRLLDEAGLDMVNYSDGEIALYSKKPSLLSVRAFEVLAQVLLEFKSLAAKHAFTFSVAIIPTWSSLTNRLELPAYPKAISSLKSRGIALEAEDLDLQSPLTRVKEMCASLDIHCVDPSSDLRDIGTRSMLPHDDHLSIEGHRVVAENILRSGILNLNPPAAIKQ